MPKWLDLPPIWLIATMASVYAIAQMTGPSLSWPRPWWTAVAIMAMGGGLAVWAAISFRMAKTTIVPHRTPSALITSGAFSYSRNPIYLADVIVLIGWGALFGAVLPFVLVPIFIWIIQIRFIRPEETRLSAEFGEEFDAYKSRTRRWI